MSAIAVSADGNNIFLALENGLGQPVFAKTTRSDLSTWTTAFAPGDGTAANVASDPANIDQMYFYGNFGNTI